MLSLEGTLLLNIMKSNAIRVKTVKIAKGGLKSVEEVTDLGFFFSLCVAQVILP